jgi:5'-deoxynucleotidase YfbR-like HD superfamily hydrolase
LLSRTVYISLAYLGDDPSSEEYIRLLLEREDWNDINRGFHLEYYDDLVFDPGLQLSHSDTLQPFPKTFESLRERLETHINHRAYGLFNIEALTLYSLAQHRHAQNVLDPAVRKDLLAFIPKLLRSTNLSLSMRQYLKMLEKNFASPAFFPGGIAEVVFKLKEQPRTGWIENKAKLNRIESVADHSMGAYLLGLLFLPEHSSGSYDKDTILKTLLVHDLAESITGDIPFAKVNEETKRKEREAFQYISMCRTYPGVANLGPYYELSRDFESGATENARIAKDIDKIENLVQLYLYSRKTKIPNFDEWREMLIRAIESSEGRRILNIIQAHFESGGEQVSDNPSQQLV